MTEPARHRQGRFPVARWSAVRALWSDPKTPQRVIAEAAQTSQPAISLALKDIAAATDTTDSVALANYYLRHYPGTKGTVTYWGSAGDVMSAAKRLTALGFVLSGDPAADVLRPWRIPTHTVAYAWGEVNDELMMSALFVPVASEERATLTLIVDSADTALLTQSTEVDDIRVAHPLHVALDLRRLFGSDRDEAAERLVLAA